MVRVITQETYDEIVKENIEEFEMTPEEAMLDAIAQFEAQGVDLSNIIKDLVLSDGEAHLVVTTVDQLREVCNNNDNDDSILKELDILKSECNKDIARRVRAGKEGAYNILLDLLEMRQKMYMQDKSEKDKKVIVSVLNTLTAMMDMQPDLLDDKGLDFIKSSLDNVQDDDILAATLRWASTCCTKHEMNRQKLFAKTISNTLKVLMEKKNAKVLSESLQLIRRMTLDDDVRVQFGKAHEHARELGVHLLEPLAKLLKENTKPPQVSELMLTIATLLVRHELCKMVADSGGVDVLFAVLADNYDNVSVIQQANKLITALAGNDDVKRDLVKSGIVPVIIAILSRHSSNANAAALIMKCVAALTLREPDHSIEFLVNGIAEAIVDCMKMHPDSDVVQKNACWAIRNMVARCRDYNSKFKELGIEALLNTAFDKFSKDFGFDIKSALRDLECDVKFDEQWTGKGVQMDQ